MLVGKRLPKSLATSFSLTGSLISSIVQSYDLDQSKYISEFKANVDFAVDLGIKGVRVDCVQPPTIHAEVDFDTLFNRLTTTWDTCINYAADKGIYVTWEFEPGFAFNKPSYILKVLDKLQHNNFGLMYDTCHGQMMGINGIRQEGEKEVVSDQLELISKFSGRINHIHLIDSDNTCHKDDDGNILPQDDITRTSAIFD